MFLLAVLVSACASQSNPELDQFLNGAVEELRGKSAEDIVACAGLPDATVNLDGDKQILAYSNVTIRIEQDPLYGLHHYHNCPTYSHSYYCSAYDRSFLGHQDLIDVVQKGCQVGFWMSNSKVEKISFELTSSKGKSHCARILQACVADEDMKSNSNTDIKAEAEAEIKSGENL